MPPNTFKDFKFENSRFQRVSVEAKYNVLSPTNINIDKHCTRQHLDGSNSLSVVQLTRWGRWGDRRGRGGTEPTKRAFCSAQAVGDGRGLVGLHSSTHPVGNDGRQNDVYSSTEDTTSMYKYEELLGSKLFFSVQFLMHVSLYCQIRVTYKSKCVIAFPVLIDIAFY